MTKRIPNLQVALDHSDLQGAIKAAVSVGQEVDIIEAGTVCQIRLLWQTQNVLMLVEQLLKIMQFVEQTG